MPTPFPENTPVGTGTAGTYYFFDSHVASEGRKYNGVFAGLQVEESVTPSMTLRISAGQFHQTDMTAPNRTLGAPTTVTLAAADSDFARVDIISIGWVGGVPIVHATAGVVLDNSSPYPNPTPPADAAGFDIVLAVVVVLPGVTAITNDAIYDRRFFLPFIYSGETNLVASSNTALGGPIGGELAFWTPGATLDVGPLYTDLVQGPAASVADEVVLYDGTTGKLIKRSSATGRPKLTAGVQSVAAIDLASEVTGDLPYANLVQAAAASRLLGRGSTSGAGDWQEITLGSGLSMASTVLSASGGGGGSTPFASQNGLYNTSSAEQALLSFTIPGGTLGADQGILWFLTGRLLCNSGTPTVTLRIKLGATTLMGDASATIAANATSRALVLWGMLTNVGATNVQRGVVDGYIGQVTAGSIAGTMDIQVANTATFAIVSGHGTAAEDTTADKVFTVSNQFSVSNVAVECAWKGVAYLTG